MYLKFEDTVDPEYQLTSEQEWMFTKVRIAENMGWTFEYIDTLTHAEVQAISAVKTATGKYNDDENRKHNQRAGVGKSRGKKPRRGRRR